MYEIYSTRVLFLFFTETSWAITIAISAFLGGLAFSSLFFSSLAHKNPSRIFLLIWAMQMAAAVYGFFILRNYELIPRLIDHLQVAVGGGSLAVIARNALMWIYLFVPAFFIGGAFPLVNGLFLESKERGVRDTGLVYFWDTVGSILGAFMAGFWLLPRVGFEATILVAVFLNIIIAAVVAPRVRQRQIILALLVILSLVKIQHILKTDSQSLTSPADGEQQNTLSEFSYLSKRFGDVLFREPSPFGQITIGNNAFGRPGNKVLFINYRDMCWSAEHGSESRMANIAIAPLPVNSRVLNIGLGCGFTAAEVLRQPNVAELDIAEINPVVAKGTARYFKAENQDVLGSPKTNLYLRDGAEYIRQTGKRYDAVVIDIEEPTVLYSSPLYTKEYFQIFRKKLGSRGVLAVWAHNGSAEFEKVMYNTLQSVFKHVTIRVLDAYYTYYASDEDYNFGSPETAEKQFISSVLQANISTVNTLDNRALEKYFNLQSFFNLPADYKEKYITDN